MTLKAMAATIALAVALASPAHAKHHRAPRHESRVTSHCAYDNSGHMTCFRAGKRIQRARIAPDANGNGARVVGGRPRGCPYQFCGCEASLYLFGRIIPSLNLASNWIRQFPRAHAAPRMAAARNHHVMVLIRHISGSDWLVHDGNSGHHVTHEHVRSIAGFVIVDPNQRLAMQ